MSITELHLHVPSEQKERIVRVFRPTDVDDARPLPVIYMHDGQNVFSGETASFGTGWEVHRALHRIGLDAMVVAIDSPDDPLDRYDEYAPWSDGALVMRTAYPSQRKSVGGKGGAYAKWLIEELKPLIDARYATFPDDTTMIGSSMGGVISLYTLFTYPDKVQRVAALSTAGWANFASLLRLIEDSPPLSRFHRCYMDVGTKEVSGPMNENDYLHTNEIISKAVAKKVSQFEYRIVPEAIHHETAWAERLPDVLRYLFAKSPSYD